MSNLFISFDDEKFYMEIICGAPLNILSSGCVEQNRYSPSIYYLQNNVEMLFVDHEYLGHTPPQITGEEHENQHSINNSDKLI